MDYKTYLPPDALKQYVKYFWSLKSDFSPSLQSFRVMADGCPGMIFQQVDNGLLYQFDKQLPETFLYGQSTRFAELNLKGMFNTIGVFFYPNALKLLFGINANELTDSCLDIDAEARKSGFYLSEQLSQAESIQEKIDIFSVYFFFLIRSNHKSENPLMQYVVSVIVESGGTVILKELRDKVQLSERSFERKFKEYVGISPKLFTRICRFQAALDQMRNNDFHKLSDVAFENDYSDQSHFIRSFREFAGFSPNEFRTQQNEIAENLSKLNP